MNYLIKALAIIMAASSLYVLLPTHWLMRHWWSFIFCFFQGTNPLNYDELWNYAAWLLFDLTLIFKLISSYGLFKFKRWGRRIAIYTLIVEISVRMVGFINAWTYQYRHPEIYSKLQSTPLLEYTVKVSMIPSYIIALLNLFILLILINNRTRESYEEFSIKEGNKIYNHALSADR